MPGTYLNITSSLESDGSQTDGKGRKLDGRRGTEVRQTERDGSQTDGKGRKSNRRKGTEVKQMERDGCQTDGEGRKSDRRRGRKSNTRKGTEIGETHSGGLVGVLPTRLCCNDDVGDEEQDAVRHEDDEFLKQNEGRHWEVSTFKNISVLSLPT